MNNKIWLASPHMSNEGFEQKFVQEAFETNWIAPAGENITKFEKELAEYVNVDYAVALSSGTAAIHLALKALGVGINDKVACQSFTFSGSANPISYVGATPVFIDSELDSWNMSPEYLKKALEDNKDIKAVIVVNLYGLPAKLNEIKKICDEYEVKLIEDAAESLGSKYRGKQTGIFGDIGIFSFNGNKIITTSGGGMLVTRSKDVAEKVKFWSTQAREPEVHYEHKEIGYNYRLSNVLAGIGRGQLLILQQRVNKKRYLFEKYKELLNKVESIEFMPVIESNEPNFWLSCILFKDTRTRDLVINSLSEKNIESRPLWKPMHLQPVFRNTLYYGLNESEELFKRGLCLPSDTKLKDEEIMLIVSIIKEELKNEKENL